MPIYTRQKKRDGNGNENGSNQGTVETLFVFLDNTQTMKGEGLQRGHRILHNLQHRIFATPTNIYLIGSNSRRIVDATMDINQDNVDEYVYNVWKADGNDGSGSYYLWEYIWFQMQNQQSTDCEIIILTDGYNTYQTGHSSRSYQGVTGLSTLMENLKANQDKLCRTFIYCVSDDCKHERAKSYLDLTIPTGGFACDASNFDDCNQILVGSHAERVEWSMNAKNEHVRAVEDGKVEAIGWFDYKQHDSRILKGSQ